MSEFNVGDKVVPISAEYHNCNSVEQWVESNKGDCCVDFFKRKGYLIYGDKLFGESRCCCNECNYGWYFSEDDLKPYEENTIETKTFTTKDLKDGMILTLRNGEERLYIRSWVKAIGNIRDSLSNCGMITQWGENFEFGFGGEKDIVKVEYMNEVLWEREKEKEYFTLEEVIKTGKKFKHRDNEEFSLGLPNQLYSLGRKSESGWSRETCKDKNNYILEQINSKVWEIEE